MAVQPERERADHERLEVVHEVAADEARRVAELGAQQQARRLERAAREHHVAGGHLVRARRRRRGSARRGRCVPLASSTTRSTYDSGRISHRPVRSALPQRRDRVALGVDRAAVVAAEPAVVARGPAVVRRRCSRRSARGTGGSRAARAASVVSTAPNMSAPGGIGYGPDAPRRERVRAARRRPRRRAARPRRSTAPSRRSRPASRRRRRRRSGPSSRARLEVDLAEAGELAVGVEAAAADGRRQVVHLARERAGRRRRRRGGTCAARGTGRARGSGGGRT